MCFVHEVPTEIMILFVCVYVSAHEYSHSLWKKFCILKLKMHLDIYVMFVKFLQFHDNWEKTKY